MDNNINRYRKVYLRCAAVILAAALLIMCGCQGVLAGISRPDDPQYYFGEPYFDPGIPEVFEFQLDEGESLEPYFDELEDGTLAMLRYSSEASGHAIIPEEINGKKGTVINTGAFASCRDVTSIFISATVTEVRNGGAFIFADSIEAFTVAEDSEHFCAVDGVLFSKDMKMLMRYPTVKEGDYIIPDTVESFGSGFSFCTGLTGVEIPVHITEIGSAFQGCKALRSLDIPDGVTYLMSGAFQGCKAMTSIKLPASLEEVGDGKNSGGLFAGCSSLTDISLSEDNEHYKTVDGVLLTKDGKELIDFPRGRTGSFTVPEEVETIWYSAFSECALTSVVIGDNVTDVGGMQLYESDKLESIYIGGDAYACSGTLCIYCDNLKEAVIGEGVTQLVGQTFEGCGSLEYLYIPASVTTINGRAFTGCDSLLDLDISKDNKSIKLVGGAVLSADGRVFLAALPALSVSDMIPEGVKEIGAYAMYGNNKLDSVYIPDGVETIGSHAFYLMNNLTEIRIPESVTDISDNIMQKTILKSEVVIICTPGSEAESYAKEMDMEIAYE